MLSRKSLEVLTNWAKFDLDPLVMAVVMLLHFPDFRGDIGLEKSDCLVFGEIRYAGKRE